MYMKISRTIPIFLIATILVFGTTISMGIPTSFAEPQYDSYEKDYDKKASGLNKQNVNCNNIIINGLNSAGQGSGGDIINPMTNDGEGDDGTGQWLGNNGDKKESNGIDNNIINFCKNKHNKIVVVTEEPQTPVEPTAILLVTKQLTCESEIEGVCEDLRTFINENSFLLQVEGNNPDPSSPFPGSVTGTDVTLGSGNYVVSEILTDAFFEAIDTLAATHPAVGTIILDLSFTGDCNPVFNEPETTGTITAGESQICNALNEFTFLPRIPE